MILTIAFQSDKKYNEFFSGREFPGWRTARMDFPSSWSANQETFRHYREKRYVGLTMHQQNFVPGSTARGNSICDAKIRNTTECRVSPILFDYYVPQKKRLRGVFLVIDSEFC